MFAVATVETEMIDSRQFKLATLWKISKSDYDSYCSAIKTGSMRSRIDMVTFARKLQFVLKSSLLCGRTAFESPVFKAMIG